MMWLILKYRQLSLSQSPGDQTKYFEISVVWDSQSVTSFTFFMYMLNFSLQESSPELLHFEMQSRTVELRNVTEISLNAHCLCILKTSVINAMYVRNFNLQESSPELLNFKKQSRTVELQKAVQNC